MTTGKDFPDSENKAILYLDNFIRAYLDDDVEIKLNRKESGDLSLAIGSIMSEKGKSIHYKHQPAFSWEPIVCYAMQEHRDTGRNIGIICDTVHQQKQIDAYVQKSGLDSHSQVVAMCAKKSNPIWNGYCVVYDLHGDRRENKRVIESQEGYPPRPDLGRATYSGPIENFPDGIYKEVDAVFSFRLVVCNGIGYIGLVDGRGVFSGCSKITSVRSKFKRISDFDLSVMFGEKSARKNEQGTKQ